MSDTPGPEGAPPTAGMPSGHADGEWVPDPSGRHEYRYVVHGQETDWVSDSGVESLDDHAEWRPDPTGRHQYRYFVRGQPTPAVSDNGVQGTDAPMAPVGGRKMPLWPFLAGGAVVALVLIVVAAVFVARNDDETSTPTTRAVTTSTAGPTTSAPTTTSTPATTSGGGRTGPISVFDLQVGDCIDTPTGPTVTGVPCAQAHDFEVFALFDIAGEPGAAYPGDSTVSDLANTGCQGERFTEYIGEDYATSSIYATSLNPSESTWTEQDDREVVCLAMAQTGQLTGSVRGSGR